MIATYELPAKRMMPKKKSYDVSFKLKAIEYAKKTSKKAETREMGVDSKQIWEWCMALSFSTMLGIR